ncbi:hypothetical protein T492DRAFT_895097 [Pavlovales sp. CCMP2436]|nr:hypothetical protein T492DRAFT_895097 [Pavlovales sp. CCMP2436]
MCHADLLVLHDLPTELIQANGGSLLRAARFATQKTQATARDASGPVVLVRQPTGTCCPAYDPAEMRGAFVLEISAYTNLCSFGKRAQAAAAAGAIGWLHVMAGQLPLTRPLPGGLSNALIPGDVARLLDAPLAADITQDSPALAWLLSATEARDMPVVSWSVQSAGEDAWEVMRMSGWLVLWRVLFIATRAPTLLRSPNRYRKTQIPVATTVLVLDILGCTLRYATHQCPIALAPSLYPSPLQHPPLPSSHVRNG